MRHLRGHAEVLIVFDRGIIRIPGQEETFQQEFFCVLTFFQFCGVVPERAIDEECKFFFVANHIKTGGEVFIAGIRTAGHIPDHVGVGPKERSRFGTVRTEPEVPFFRFFHGEFFKVRRQDTVFDLRHILFSGNGGEAKQTGENGEKTLHHFAPPSNCLIRFIRVRIRYCAPVRNASISIFLPSIRSSQTSWRVASRTTSTCFDLRASSA